MLYLTLYSNDQVVTVAGLVVVSAVMVANGITDGLPGAKVWGHLEA